MKPDVREWVIDFFEKRKDGIPGNTLEGKLKVDFFSAGLLDSLDVVNLIVSIEQDFDVTLGPENMQDRRFCYIGGLSEIISEITDNTKR